MNMIQGKKIFVRDYLREYQKAKKQTNQENVAPVSIPINHPLRVGKRKLKAPEINTKDVIKNTVNENLVTKKPKIGEIVDSSLLQRNVINSNNTLRRNDSFDSLFSSILQSSNSDTSNTESTTHSSKEDERQNTTKFAKFTPNISNLDQKKSDNSSKLIQSKEINTPSVAITKKIEDAKKPKMGESLNSSQLQENVTNSDKTPRKNNSFDQGFDLLFSSLLQPSDSSTSAKNRAHSSQGVDRQNKTNFDQKQSDNASKPIQSEEIATPKSATTVNIEEKNLKPTFEQWMNSILTPNILSSNQEKSDAASKPGHSKETSEKSINEKNKSSAFERFMNAMLSPNIPNLVRRKNDRTFETKSSREASTQTSSGDSILDLLTPPSIQNREIIQVASTQTVTETQVHDDVDLTQTFSQMTTRCENFATQSFSNQEEIPHLLPYFDPRAESHTQEITSQLSQASTQQSSVQPSQINPDNEAMNEDLNILQVLANDITLTPQNKFQFNNIAKIGTEKWLHFAQAAIVNHKRKVEKTEVETVYNCFDDVYSNNPVKQKVKCYREGKIRKYRLENVESDDDGITVSSSLSSEDLEECSQGERSLRIEIDEMLKDKNLICTEQSPNIDKDKVKSMINDIFVRVYSVYENGKIPRFGILSHFNRTHCIFIDGRFKLNPSLKWRKPSKTPYKITNKRNFYLKFCQILYLMGKIYSLLETNKLLTKREVYYQIKHLVKSQAQVNRAIQMVSILLNVGEWHLNIISNSGLVYGNLKLVWSSGEVTNCNVPATMIPSNADDISEFHTNAYFILVVEKESIFQKLIQEDLPNKLSRPFILITGKGFSNFSTQLFLKKISTVMALPVFILVDADVHGIRIMLQYRFGSCGSCHLSEYLAVPNARWLGVFPSEINTLGIKNLPLTTGEKNNIKCLLKYPCMESHPQIAEEVRFLLNNNKKSSIEGLIKNDNFLSGFYLPSKLKNRDFL